MYVFTYVCMYACDVTYVDMVWVYSAVCGLLSFVGSLGIQTGDRLNHVTMITLEWAAKALRGFLFKLYEKQRPNENTSTLISQYFLETLSSLPEKTNYVFQTTVSNHVSGGCGWRDGLLTCSVNSISASRLSHHILAYLVVTARP